RASKYARRQCCRHRARPASRTLSDRSRAVLPSSAATSRRRLPLESCESRSLAVLLRGHMGHMGHMGLIGLMGLMGLMGFISLISHISPIIPIHRESIFE